jgi:hypothetical protein
MHGTTMIFTPSQEIQDRMRSERAGVFVDRSLNEPHRWLVAKIPTNVIREIIAGAPIVLRAWIVAIDDMLVLTFGLSVFDDPAAPATYFGSCRSDIEAESLRVLLSHGAFPLQFHNETFLPLLYAECRVDQTLADDVLKLAPSVGYPEEKGLKIRKRANDVVQEALSGKADLRIRAFCDLPVSFSHTQPIQVYVAGVGEVEITDSDEGGELEQLTQQAFESLFHFGTFINPRVGEALKQRELCDVLAVSRVREVDTEGVFVVQNKVASAFPDGLKRRTERRAKTIQNNILKAIAQLTGAIRALKAGEAIYRAEDGSNVEVDPPIAELVGTVEPLNLKERANQVGHGIVVISDMHEMVDRHEVLVALAEASLATGYCCQVLDLQELGRLITHSRERPALLENLLWKRMEAMVERKDPFIRFNFIV